eukprot:3939901-Rhodomonas_salina.1
MLGLWGFRVLVPVCEKQRESFLQESQGGMEKAYLGRSCYWYGQTVKSLEQRYTVGRTIPPDSWKSLFMGLSVQIRQEYGTGMN